MLAILLRDNFKPNLGSGKNRRIFEAIALYLETLAYSHQFKESALAYFKDVFLDPNYVPSDSNVQIARTAIQAYIDGEPNYCPFTKGKMFFWVFYKFILPKEYFRDIAR